jgi:glycerol-3-phosphate acyltransferase PlsY
MCTKSVVFNFQFGMGGKGVATQQASLLPLGAPPVLIAFHYAGTTAMLLLTECFAVVKSGSCFPK